MFELQLHTAVRPVEAATARWEEFNLKEGQWVIPAEKMKKNREHIIPLSKQVLDILEIMRPISSHRDSYSPALKTH